MGNLSTRIRKRNLQWDPAWNHARGTMPVDAQSNCDTLRKGLTGDFFRMWNRYVEIYAFNPFPVSVCPALRHQQVEKEFTPVSLVAIPLWIFPSQSATSKNDADSTYRFFKFQKSLWSKEFVFMFDLHVIVIMFVLRVWFSCLFSPSCHLKT